MVRTLDHKWNFGEEEVSCTVTMAKIRWSVLEVEKKRKLVNDVHRCCNHREILLTDPSMFASILQNFPDWVSAFLVVMLHLIFV